jgi:HEAT repeat protein
MWIINKIKHYIPLILFLILSSSYGFGNSAEDLSDQRKSVARLVREVNNDNAYMRRNALEALGKVKDPGTVSLISESLYDDDLAVRQRVAWALGESGTENAADSLLSRLPIEKAEPVRIEIVRALGKLKNRKATLCLVDELKYGKNSLYTNEIVIALGEIGDWRALDVLNEHINNLQHIQKEHTELVTMRLINGAVKIAKEAVKKIEGE